MAPREDENNRPAAPRPNSLETNREFQQQYTACLEKLEHCLETPFVPGELERWFEQTQQAMQDVAKLLPRQLDETHAQQLQEIESEDPGLEHRVEEIRRVDGELRERFAQFHKRVDQLAKGAGNVEPDEARMKEACYELVDEGLALVIAARKQEVALRTWLLEAFDRDRGVVD